MVDFLITPASGTAAISDSSSVSTTPGANKLWASGTSLYWGTTQVDGGGGGTPGGSDTQVQFNDGGSFGGNSGFVFDKTNKRVAITSNTQAPFVPLHLKSETQNTNQPRGIQNAEPTDKKTILFLDNNSSDVNEKMGMQFGGYSNYSIGGIFGLMDSNSGHTTGDITIDMRASGGDASLTEKFRFTHEGNLGIGTSSPTKELYLSKGEIGMVTSGSLNLGGSLGDNYFKVLRANGDGIVSFRDNGNTYFDGQNLIFETTSQNYFQLKGTNVLGFGSGRDFSMSASGNVFYMTSGTEAPSATPILGIKQDGKVGIGISSPGAYLDVAADNITALFGSDDGAAGTRTNSTNKVARIGLAHYTNAEEPAALLVPTSTTDDNYINYGGGSSSLNATTIHRWYTAANNITTNGTERMRLNETGLGIGTAAPNYKLDVNGDANVSSVLYLGDSDTKLFRSSNDLYIRAHTDILLNDTGGNVGVGIDPTSKLHVKGDLDIQSGNQTILMGAGNSSTSRNDNALKLARVGLAHYENDEAAAAMIYASSDGTDNAVAIGGGTSGMNAATKLQFFTAANDTTTEGTERMRIDSAGKVGIGTSAPNNTLEVAGVIRGTNYIWQKQDGSPGILVGNGGNADIYYDGTDMHINSQRGGSGDLLINTGGGNVGIGTNSPADKLNINTGVGTFDFRDYNMTYSTSLGIRAEAGYLGLVTEAADDVFISTSGFANKRLVVKSDGDIGIGTTSPSTKLNIVGTGYGGNTTGSALFQLYGTDTVGPTLTFRNNQSEYGSIYYGDTGAWIPQGTMGFIQHRDGASSDVKMVIASGGKVGIGTTTPAQYLHVKSGDTDQALKLQSTDGNVDATFTDSGGSGIIRFATDTFKFYTDSGYSNNPLSLKGVDVGIGTNSPAGKLHVVGTTKIEGGILKNYTEALYMYDAAGGLYGAAAQVSTDGNFCLIKPETGPGVGSIPVYLPEGTAAKVGFETTIVNDVSNNPASTLTVSVAQGTSNVIYEGSSNSASSTVTIGTYKGANKTFLLVDTGIWIVKA